MPWKSWSTEKVGVAFALLAAFGFSLKAIFVKNFHNYTKKPSQHHA